MKRRCPMTSAAASAEGFTELSVRLAFSEVVTYEVDRAVEMPPEPSKPSALPPLRRRGSGSRQRHLVPGQKA